MPQPEDPKFGEREGKVTPLMQKGVVKSLDEPTATEWARYLEAQKAAHDRRIEWASMIWPPILVGAALVAPIIWLWRWAIGAL